MKCPKCGELLHPDQPWRLQPDLEAGKLETEYEPRHEAGQAYMHKDCAEAVKSALPDSEVRWE